MAALKRVLAGRPASRPDGVSIGCLVAAWLGAGMIAAAATVAWPFLTGPLHVVWLIAGPVIIEVTLRRHRRRNR